LAHEWDARLVRRATSLLADYDEGRFNSQRLGQNERVAPRLALPCINKLWVVLHQVDDRFLHILRDVSEECFFSRFRPNEDFVVFLL
jgi:hypothetical protein